MKKDNWITRTSRHLFSKELEPKNRYKRSFNAARYGRTNDLGSTRNINNDLVNSLETVRDRCRQLAQNDPYINKALTLWKTNTIGHQGITLHPQCKKANGDLDPSNNETIQDAWWDWNRYGNSTVSGGISGTFRDQQIIESVARDGEVLIVKRQGQGYGKYRFQLEIIPIEHFPSYYIGVASNGNLIFQSIEFDEYMRPVAYWIVDAKQRNGYQGITGLVSLTPTVRIPADQCYHLFEQRYPGQTRGFPWIVTSVLPTHHLNEYKLAELQQARLASANQLFFTAPSSPEGMDEEDLDAMGNINIDLVNAQAQILPQGVDIRLADWNTPNSDMPEFVKTQLKGIASGLCLSYSAIANDLESINFSSAKYADLADQINYKNKQQWFIESFLDRVYRDWLAVQLLNGNLGTMPFSKYDKYCNVKWTPTGFRGVNANEQAKALMVYYSMGVMSLSDVSAELGYNLEETIDQIARENKLLDERGIKLLALKDLYALMEEEQQPDEPSTPQVKPATARKQRRK